MGKFKVYHKDKEWSYNIDAGNSTVAMWFGMNRANGDGFKFPICKVCVRSV